MKREIQVSPHSGTAARRDLEALAAQSRPGSRTRRTLEALALEQAASNNSIRQLGLSPDQSHIRLVHKLSLEIGDRVRRSLG